MTPTMSSSDKPSRTERRRAYNRRQNASQRGGPQNRSQHQAHPQESGETHPNQRLSVPSVQRGRPSHGRNNARGRGGSSAQGQLASQIDPSYFVPGPVNAPVPFPALPQLETPANQVMRTWWTAEGVDGQWWSTTTDSVHVNGALYSVETSSVWTPSESTGMSSMNHPSALGAITPASEPPEPWPAAPAGHSYIDIGAQFESGSAKSQEGRDSDDLFFVPSGNIRGTCHHPVIVVTSDGQVDVVQPGVQSNLSPAKVEDDGIDILSSLPLDMSKSHLDWMQNGDWLDPIPLRVPRASTFPLMGIYHVDDEMVSDCPSFFDQIVQSLTLTLDGWNAALAHNDRITCERSIHPIP
jgi:hypothetical protein